MCANVGMRLKRLPGGHFASFIETEQWTKSKLGKVDESSKISQHKFVESR